jgi:hypothetical protein
MPKKIIDLRPPTLLIANEDLPNLSHYLYCADQNELVSKNDPLSKFPLDFKYQTELMRAKFGAQAKWENIIIGAHGAYSEMSIYGGVDLSNIRKFAKPMENKVKDIWLLSCTMGSTPNGVQQAHDSFKAVKRLAPPRLYDHPGNMHDSDDWDPRDNPALARQMERIKPGSVEQLLQELKSAKLLNNQDKCEDAVINRWWDLNAKAACIKFDVKSMGFAPQLAIETGANVWASPHIQGASIRPLNKGTLDHFEGDLYKFAPGQAAHLVSRRPLFSVDQTRW